MVVAGPGGVVVVVYQGGVVRGYVVVVYQGGVVRGYVVVAGQRGVVVVVNQGADVVVVVGGAGL